MKGSISTTTIFKIILVFTMIFAGFLAIAITYNKAYKQKNEVVSILEKYEGVSSKSLEIINNYLKNSNYDVKGLCGEGQYGMSSLDSNYLVKAQNGVKYFYCLDYYCNDNNINKNNINRKCVLNNNRNNYIYYNVRLFFNFNLPFFGDIMTFKITGDTKAIKYYKENQKLS